MKTHIIDRNKGLSERNLLRGILCQIELEALEQWSLQFPCHLIAIIIIDNVTQLRSTPSMDFGLTVLIIL